MQTFITLKHHSKCYNLSLLYDKILLVSLQKRMVLAMLGIICAMEKELDNLNSMIQHKKVKIISKIQFINGILNGMECVTAICGIGKVAAAICTQAMIQNYNPDYLINIGVAGSLKNNIKPCSVVIAKDLIQHDMDTSALGDKKGLISGINKIEIETSDYLTSKLVDCVEELENIDYHVGRILTGDNFIADNKRRKALVDEFNGLACEMEGAAIAQTCYINDTPFAVVRAISDSADNSAEISYDEFLPLAVETSHRIIIRLIEKLAQK